MRAGTSLPLMVAFAAMLSSAGSCAPGSGGGRETGWWNEECPEAPTCSLHACAAQAGDAGISCCLAAEGRGLDSDAAAELAGDCDPEVMSCDPGDYLGEAAALCIAQVAGLTTGGGACGGHFWVNGTAGAAWWIMTNMHAPDCAEGDCVEVDAVTGAFDPESVCAWAD